MGRAWALTYLTALSLSSIILLMLLCCFCIFCSQPFLPFGCFLVSICPFLHWRSQCDSAWSMPLIGLSWLPSRLPCNSLQFHQGSRTYLLSMGLLCRYNCCNYYYCNSNLRNDWKLTWKKKNTKGRGGDFKGIWTHGLSVSMTVL